MLLALVFILVFGLLVFVHEFGHFIVAKKLGVKVEEFGFGFPPRILGIQKGETLYSLNLIPLGGFVKLFGETGEDEKNPRSYTHQKVGGRVMILLAGVTMNILLAIVLYTGLYTIGAPVSFFEEPKVESGATIVEEFKLRVVQVEKGSPADLAGIKDWDQLISINGVKLETAKSLGEYTRAHAGETVNIEIITGTQTKILSVKLRPKDDKNPPLGVSPVGLMRLSYPFPIAFLNGLKETTAVFINIFLGLGTLIAGLFGPEKVADSVAGPVGIGVLLNQFIKLGVPYVIKFAGFLSVTLAVFNVLPIPALDGGKLPFLLIEKIRKRRVKPELENAVHAVGFAVLLILIAFVTYSDIRKLFVK